MSVAKVVALARILHEAGLTWAAADEIVAAVDRINEEGLRSDDVAGALLGWRRLHGRRALRLARVRAQHLLDRRNNCEDQAYDEKNVLHEDDCSNVLDADQMLLFDDAATTMARVSMLARCAAAAVQKAARP